MNTPALDAYSRAAERAANEVIASYSTSFGAATRLLGVRHRQHIRNIYALVRVADEIVDGVAREAGLAALEQAAALDRFVGETHRALAVGFSTDLIVHAFARTARDAGIGRDMVDPFFASMRSDLRRDAAAAGFDESDHDDYVYGSAEVVGLMCLAVFLRSAAPPPAVRARLEHGARQLGAAFQDVNFLRDLADDTDRLGRAYLGTARRITTTDRDRIVARVRAQLASAEAAIGLLPTDARVGVRSAAGLFSAVTDRIARTPVTELYRRRVRVPEAQKAVILARAIGRTWPTGRTRSVRT